MARPCQIGLTSTEPRRAGLPVLLKAGNPLRTIGEKMNLEECLKGGPGWKFDVGWGATDRPTQPITKQSRSLLHKAQTS